jgi:3',5'-cyclic AMP phosphodiesterase CpdA
MSFIVVQISDIHFQAPQEVIASRATSLVKAVLAEIPKPDACLLVFTGDVANTGDKAEYEVAKSFVSRIISGFQIAGISDCRFVGIPGNHDLNLRTEDATRKFLLNSLDKYLADDIDFHASTFESII